MALTHASSIPRGAVIGQPPTFGIIPPLTLFVDVEEMLNNGSALSGSSALSRQLAFTGSNQDAAVYFHGATHNFCTFVRPIPDAWQGATIKLYGKMYHRTGGLTGTGSPPDDQIKIEAGWETVASGVTHVDLGTRNDGTAPHETNTNQQLGTAVDSPLYVEVAEIAIGVSDRILHGRLTRDASDSSDDGLGAGMWCVGIFGAIPEV